MTDCGNIGTARPAAGERDGDGDDEEEQRAVAWEGCSHNRAGGRASPRNLAHVAAAELPLDSGSVANRVRPGGVMAGKRVPGAAGDDMVPGRCDGCGRKAASCGMVEHGWTVRPTAAGFAGAYCPDCAVALQLLPWTIRCARVRAAEGRRGSGGARRVSLFSRRARLLVPCVASAPPSSGGRRRSQAQRMPVVILRISRGGGRLFRIAVTVGASCRLSCS